MGVQSSAEADARFNNVPSATLFDDFFNYTTAGLFTTLAKAAGTTAADDTGGVDNILVTTAATASDYQGLTTTKANFLLTAGQSLWAAARASYTSYSPGANSAGVYFGFWSSTPAVTDSTTTPEVSYTGAIIYALSGDTAWRTQSSNGATKTNHLSTLAIVEGVMHQFRIDIINWDGSNAQVTYSVDGQTLMDTNYPNKQIIDKVAFTSAVKMKLGMYWMAGKNAGSNAQTGSIDYLTGSKARV